MEQKLYSSEIENVLAWLGHMDRSNPAISHSPHAVSILLLHASDAFILRWMMTLRCIPKAAIVVIENTQAMQKFLVEIDPDMHQVLIQKSLYVRFYPLVVAYRKINIIVL